VRVTIKEIQDMKRRGEKIPVLTAYDYTTAKLVEDAGIQVLLVGDSLGQVVLGYDTTVPVTMDEMVHHIRAVARGAQKAHIIGDMPFMSYQADQSDAVRNAGRILKEGGCQSVKLEGGRTVAGTVSRIVQTGIPVMGHIGLTPQAVNQIGGYRVQGKTPDDAARLLDDALALQEAGAYALVIELVPTPLSELISKRLTIPTIGIGAGAGCDGQVQVLHDMLGLFDDFVPKHARRFAQLGAGIRSAVEEYVADVQAMTFPSDDESFKMEQAVVEELEAATSRP
jgi:3-methyl-2-oxobutanoate hydroxymethyltransferase